MAIINNNTKQFQENYDLYSDYKLKPDSVFYQTRESIHIADSIIKSDPKYINIFRRSECYWILITHPERLIGPLDLVTFRSKCDSLRLPASMKF